MSPQARQNVSVQPLQASDEAEFLAAVARSRALHRPWVAPPATAQAYADYLARMQPPLNHAWAVKRRSDGALVGVINLSNIVMGCFRSGYLGYYAFSPYAGQGLMKAGLQAALRQAFGVLKLHRLEANIQPDNTASKALVQSCGFEQEGYSPKYLKIGGRWRDHERWACRAD
ncbi:GNAT family N-acetyltransferase [Roseateles sp. BYS180W]|uniref:GNAT family N-acetyltransferase n=1 Tax=Roseateles rivi TaxID=3299028 RepID=A0ABW7FY49_9BURK